MMPPNEELREWSKEWLKLTNNFHDEGAHIIDGIDHRHKVPLGPLAGGQVVGIGEAYSRREVACHVHVSLYCGWDDLYTQNLCARCEKLTVAHVAEVDGAGCLAENLGNLDTRPEGKRQCGDYYPVLVVVGECSEPGEGVDVQTVLSVPSLVRLVPLDDCPVFGGNTDQDPALEEVFGGGAGGRTSAVKGKLDLLGVSGLSSPAVKAGELPYEVVQRPPEIVDNVSHDKAPTTESLVRERCFSPKDVVSALAVELQAQTYSVAWRHDGTSSVDGADLALKGIAVLFGPIELGPTPVEVGPVAHGWQKGGVMAGRRDKPLVRNGEPSQTALL